MDANRKYLLHLLLLLCNIKLILMYYQVRGNGKTIDMISVKLLFYLKLSIIPVETLF